MPAPHDGVRTTTTMRAQTGSWSEPAAHQPRPLALLLLSVAFLGAGLAEASLPRATSLGREVAADASPGEQALAPPVLVDDEASGREAPRFPLFAGDELALESHANEASLHPLQGLALLDDEPLPDPPSSYPETRIRAFELSAPFRVGDEAELSLWTRQACGFVCPEVVSDSREDPLGLCVGLDNVPCSDYAKELWKVPFQNIRDFSVGAVKGAGKVVNFATGGATSGLKKGYDAFRSTSGSFTQKLQAAGDATAREQANVMTLGFSEAPDKLQHASNLVGTGAIDRGSAAMFEGALEGDWDKSARGFAEFGGGIGQVSGITATAYAPFAPKAAPVVEPAPPAPSIGPTVGDLRAAGLKDAHHVIQDASVRDLSGYETNAAPGVQLPGPSTSAGTPHYAATRVQRQAGGGTYAAERRIGYKALRQAGLSEEEARAALARADSFFDSLGVGPDTTLRRPGNRPK